MVTTQRMANAKQLCCTCCSYQLGNAAAQGPNQSNTAGDVAGGRLLVLAQLQAINIKNTVKQAQLGNIIPSRLVFALSHSQPDSIVSPACLQRLVSERQLWREREAFFPSLLPEFFHAIQGVEHFQDMFGLCQ